MSVDIKLQKNCDHRVIQEQLQIDPDLKTIRIPRAIVSQELELWINGYLIDRNHSKFKWTVEEDETTIYTKKSKIVFKNKRKSLDDFYFLSYSVNPKFCPKCLGLRVINDHSYSKLGKILTVKDEEKLLQEIRKGITTELESNPFHKWIGTEIYKYIGAKIFNPDIIRARLIQEITRYLEKYVDVQIQQAQFQEVTDREAFFKVLSIQVEPQYDIDISYWVVTIIFRNRSGENLLFEKNYQIPGKGSLLYGSNL